MINLICLGLKLIFEKFGILLNRGQNVEFAFSKIFWSILFQLIIFWVKSSLNCFSKFNIFYGNLTAG